MQSTYFIPGRTLRHSNSNTTLPLQKKKKKETNKVFFLQLSFSFTNPSEIGASAEY